MGESVTVGAAATFTVTDFTSNQAPAPVLLSVTRTLNVELPVAVGVPLSVPPLKLMPNGSVPDSYCSV